jgi:hypothetical protein
MTFLRTPVLLATAAAALAAAPRAAAAQSDTDFTWSGRIPSGRWIYVKNMNGEIRVERGTGSSVEVTARKRANDGGDPASVRIVTLKASDNESMVVCALWSEDSSCDQDSYRGGRNRNRDWDDRRGNVNVTFTVRVPDGVKVDVMTVNGGLQVDGVGAEVVARTTNGSVRAETRGGPVRAHTTNGSITARMGALGDARELDFTTTNGSVTVEVPPSLGAEIEMSTVNGRVETEFPVTLSGRIDPRRLRATIGDGSRRVRMKTVNGSVSLRKAGA